MLGARRSPSTTGTSSPSVGRSASDSIDVVRERQGRRNRYQVKTKLPLRHPLAQEREVCDLLEVLVG
jgi:hypothetical protein